MLTLFNSQVGRSTRSVSRPDGYFHFRKIPLGWSIVEVWFPNNPYPRTLRVAVNQIAVSNIGTIQLDMPIGMQSPQGIGGIPPDTVAGRKPGIKPFGDFRGILSRAEIEFAEEEKDSGSEVVEGAEAARIGLDGLDA